VVTHDVAEAVTLADRVLMIEARQITLNHRSIFSARAGAAPEVAALEGQVLRELSGIDRDEITLRLDLPALVKLAWMATAHHANGQPGPYIDWRCRVWR
jgi:ABC-type proline/glycine betaine transport system ATPase subunit